VYGVSFSIDGHTLASAGYDNTLQIYDWETKTHKRTIQAHDTQCFCVDVSTFWGDGRAIATSGDDMTVRVWDAKSAQQVAKLTGHTRSVMACAFSPTAPILVSASHDGNLMMWDLKIAAKEIATRPGSPGRTSRASGELSSPMNVSAGSPNKNMTKKEQREASLKEVFRMFDLDGEGTVDAKELQALGQARRSTGQKAGTWTPEQNARLLKSMDTDGDGTIDEGEFCTFFAAKLPSDPDTFNTTIEQFKEVAKSLQNGSRRY